MPTLSWDIFYRDHGAERGLKNLGTVTNQLHLGFSKAKLGAAALGLAAGAGLVAAGRAAVRFGTDSVKAYGEAQQSQLRLQNAFERFPKLADTNIGALQRLNIQLAQKTRYDDDATASGQAVLAQFGLTGQQITKLTPLLQDYAAKTGKDIPAAASVLGKALLGKGRALAAVGINFKDTGSRAKNYDQILGGLRTQVGGFAEKEGKSFAGQIEIIKNRFGEWQESLGGGLVGRLTNVLGGVTAVMDVAEESGPILNTIWDGFIEGAGLSKAASKDLAEVVKTHQGDITDAIFETSEAFLGIVEVGEVTAAAILVIFGNLTSAVGTMLHGLQVWIHQAATVPFAPKWLKDLDNGLQSASEKMSAGGQSAEQFGRDLDERIGGGVQAARDHLAKLRAEKVSDARQRDAAETLAGAVKNIGKQGDYSRLKLKDFNLETDYGSRRQRTFRNRLADAHDALVDQYNAAKEAGVKHSGLNKIIKDGEQKFYKEFIQMGYSKEEARKLAIRYANVQKKVRTEFVQPGMVAAQRESKDLQRILNNFKNKSLSYRIAFSSNASNFAQAANTSLQVGARRTAAKGGPINAQTPWGWFPRYAYGGRVQNFSGQGEQAYDTEPAMLRVNEHVWTPEEVRGAGGHKSVEGLRKAARRGALHLAEGGSVDRTMALKYSANHIDPSGAMASVGRSASRYGLAWGNAYAAAVKKALAASFGGAPGTGSSRHVQWHGGTFTERFRNTLIAAQRIAGYNLPVIQGGFRPRTSYSGTSHQGDAIDTSYSGNLLRGLRRAGVAAWFRGPWVGMPYHIHGVPLPGKGYAGGSGIWQAQDYLRGGDGLATGGLARRPGLYPLAERGAERVLSARQTRSFERLVKVMDCTGGTGDTYITINAPNYVGSTNELRQTLVSMAKRGELQVVQR